MLARMLGLKGGELRDLTVQNAKWYDIVHFEHKCLCLPFGLSQKASLLKRVFLDNKPMIIP